MSVYTVGIWITKPGQEDEFAGHWREKAEWTNREVSSEARGTLLQDREQRNRFVSFGPWPLSGNHAEPDRVPRRACN